ncbi:proteasome assembly chaperone family protein [Actinokineospora xionganensis]|nr:PAC2 family protein [Actinokineospora xionganensis]
MDGQGDLYDVDSDVPDLTGTVLLHNFEGFMDAGSAGRLVAEHLLDTLEHRVVARFDADRLIDYRARRPTMTYLTDHWESYAAPELAVHLVHDSEGMPFLLLTGPEPDREWERFTAAVGELIERWGVRLAVGFHGIPMGVPHTRPLEVTAHATRPDLVRDYRQVFSRIQVPASIANLLEFREGEAGRDAMGFAAHVPHYLSHSSYPAAALSLLDSIERATGLTLPAEPLREAKRKADVEIERQIAESDEVSEGVRALEHQYDSFAEAAGRNMLADPADMPTADELGSQFERFLAEQDGDR